MPEIGDRLTARRLARVRPTRYNATGWLEGYGRSDRCGPTNYQQVDPTDWRRIEDMSTSSVSWFVTNEVRTGFVIGRGRRFAGHVKNDWDFGNYWVPTGPTITVLYLVDSIDGARPWMVLEDDSDA